MRFAALLLTLVTVTAEAQTRIMPVDKEALLRSVIPEVADPVLANRLASPNLFLYTDEEMPAAYQGNGRFILVRRGVANDGNHRFPWAKPGGLQRVKGVGGFRFISLPEDALGVKPIIYFNAKLDKSIDRNNSLVWMFPIGTVVGEVFTQTGPDGLDYTWEMRTRTRERDDWDAEVYRPFPNAKSLIEGIKTLRPEWETEQATRQVIDDLAALRNLRTETLTDSQNVTRIFRSTAGVYPLPKMEAALVNDLLMNATFESTAGLPFFEGGNNVAALAPTNPGKGWNIVPVNFDGAFVGNDRRSCMECHETFGMNQRRVDGTWVGGRGEELHFKGSDGIGSFRPTTNRFDGSLPEIRPELLAGGFVARYNPEVHTKELYSPISKLRFEP